VKRTIIIGLGMFVILALTVSLGRFVWHHALEFYYARQPAARMPCVGELRIIDGAKAAWALENHKTTNDIPTDTDLFGPTQYVRVKPTCPKGGTYTIGAVGEKPRCSIPGHTI
jgi:hypothetical protein